MKDAFQRRFRSWRNGCLRKKRYHSQDMADAVAKRAHKRRGVPLSSYRCRWCKGWHITSRNAETRAS